MNISMITPGSVWRSNDYKKFRVISVTEVDGHTWVHYRLDVAKSNITECEEYSCYAESFLQRFTSSPE